MAEAGYPGMTGGSWIGLLAPARTPNEIVHKLSAELQQVLQLPEIRDKLIDYGIDPVGGTPEQFDAFIRSEAGRWAEVVKKADIRLE
jgi:tripartite-type tricarboxylate transporter receptor subunit TctC